MRLSFNDDSTSSAKRAPITANPTPEPLPDLEQPPESEKAGISLIAVVAGTAGVLCLLFVLILGLLLAGKSTPDFQLTVVAAENVITSPIDGSLSRVYIEAEQFVDAGTPLFVIASNQVNDTHQTPSERRQTISHEIAKIDAVLAGETPMTDNETGFIHVHEEAVQAAEQELAATHERHRLAAASTEDIRHAEAQLRAAQATLAKAKVDHQQENRSVLSRIDLQLRREELHNRLSKLSYAAADESPMQSIVAPESGTISPQLVPHKHQRVVAGQHIASITSQKRRWLQVEIAQSEADRPLVLETPSVCKVSHPHWQQAMSIRISKQNPIAASGQVTYRASPTDQYGRDLLQRLAIGQQMTTTPKPVH
jgi:multidrug resistance efflux pump